MLNLNKARLVVAFVCFCAAASALLRGQTPSGTYTIGVQDVLMITLIDEPQLSGRYTVEADGEFTFPLIGRIKAAGLTPREFEAALRKRLADGYFTKPQVTVSVAQYQSQRIYINGEVRVPGTQLLTGSMTLVEALARAGSTLPTASGEVAIVREKVVEPIRVNIKNLESGKTTDNVELKDGDQVYVLRAEAIYVFGEVKSPGMFTAQPGITVMQAIALAGGNTPNAAMNRLKIQRVENGKRIEIKVKPEDPVRPGDTIIVPERFF